MATIKSDTILYADSQNLCCIFIIPQSNSQRFTAQMLVITYYFFFIDIFLMHYLCSIPQIFDFDLFLCVQTFRLFFLFKLLTFLFLLLLVVCTITCKKKYKMTEIRKKLQNNRTVLRSDPDILKLTIFPYL